MLLVDHGVKEQNIKDHVVNYDKLMDFVLALGLSTPANKTDHPLAENWQHEVLTLAQEFLVEYVAYLGGIKYSVLLEPNFFDASREKGLVILARLQSIFMQGSYEDDQQIKEEINALYHTFDEEIKNCTRLELKKIIALCDKAIEVYELKVKKLAEVLKPAMDIHQEFIKQLNTCNNLEEAVAFMPLTLEEMGKLTRERDIFYKYSQEGICISRSELVSCFTEEELDCFSAHFVQKRASINNDIPLENINEFIAGTLKPFIQVDKESFCIPLANSLYRSLRFHLESILIRDQKIKNRVQKHRGKYLEDAATKQLKAIFEDLGTIYSSVFESAKSENEHDIIVLYQKTLLIIEGKTTLISDYFSRLSKDRHQKLEQQFKRSIQAGYAQGLRLKKLIMSQEKTKLYDQKGNVVITINRADFTSIECICITLESEGAFASSLNILLRKDDEEDYPYCINLRDLTQLATYKDDKEIELTPRKFVRFLKERKHLHGKVFSNDELDYWGCFLAEGSFDKYLNNQPCYLDPSFSKTFDEASERTNKRASSKTTLQL